MLAVDAIEVRYGSIAALRGVSIHVQAGELVALIGVNGAGKTTLLSTIAGVLKPVRGGITFQGTSIAGLSPEAIAHRGIALVPEGRGMFPSLTVQESLRLGAFGRNRRAEFKRDLEEICQLFPILGERLHQPSGTLSGGEQQQLAIARALMAHPQLLMLDEPSLGLAPALVDQIFALITRLHQAGVTILLVEQNVDRTLEIVDRAYLLNTGQIQAEGSPEQVRRSVDITRMYLGGA